MSVKLAAEKAKSLEAVKMAHALSDLELPPEVVAVAEQGQATAPATIS